MGMNIFRMMELAGNALSVQRLRMNLISGNIANAQTTRTPEGGPYRRRDVILAEESPRDRFGGALNEAMTEGGRSVKVQKVTEDQEPPRMVFDPDHPDADAEGYVAMPNVNSLEEMVALMSTMRGYQANLQAFQASTEMSRRALSLGRNG